MLETTRDRMLTLKTISYGQVLISDIKKISARGVLEGAGRLMKVRDSPIINCGRNALECKTL